MAAHPFRTPSALLAPGLAAVLLLGAAAGPAPAPATAAARSAAAAPVARGTAAVSRTSPVQARIVFVKDPRHPFASRLLWRVTRPRSNGTRAVVDRASWRAGSGFGGPHTTDECVRNRGWLPDGHYSFVQYDDYWGSLIKGRAFFLGSHRCRNGTTRTELFIHTETGAHNRQCADRRGDQVCRWEWPRINDYRSHGCVKMSPRDIADLVRHYHRWFRPRVRYPMSRVQVVVRH